MVVRFYGLDNNAEQIALGALRFQNGKIVASNDAMKRVLAEPIRPYGGAQPAIDAAEQPEEFMRALPLVYKSPYFTASV